MKLKKSFKGKKLIVFDLDGTLTFSKAPIRRDMVRLLEKLLEQKTVAVIGGGRYEQFRQQFIGKAKFRKELMTKLPLFPTSAAAFYRWQNGWKKVYAYELSAPAKKKIFAAFREVFRKINYRHPQKVYGRVIEDRKTQITFSAVGQKAPIPIKERWHGKNDKLRTRLAKLLAKKLPNLEVRTGGSTSIDVTRKGIDKAYGIRQIRKALRVGIKDMLFVGDRIFPGGNDYAVVRTGVDYVKVRGPAEAKKVIKFLLAKR
ncbi:MAG: HAD-IIB family hydrolase [Candidatus Sungbacteria bacterium]|uniref:phosphomannomutase n=1 Tax=Candidatus Sungiibacteriota bacterium TaxID=2750080 RepID=A0A932YXX2_9BACT|nr:HAD-IIB family hydrolase [Candidatus Sungbacteria bacterium]